jgi:hypothetical protein
MESISQYGGLLGRLLQIGPRRLGHADVIRYGVAWGLACRQCFSDLQAIPSTFLSR